MERFQYQRICLILALLITCITTAIAYDFDVAEFGAFPDDNIDDSAVFNKVIDLIRWNKTAGRIVLHPGTYDISNQLTLYKPCNNITIEGNGATLKWSAYKLGLYILECKGITIQNLFLDYDPLPFTGGRVISVNNTDKSFDIAIAAPHNAYEKVVQGYITYDLDRGRFGTAGSTNATIRSVDVYQLTSTKVAQIIQNGPTTVLRAFSEASIPSALLHQNIVVRHQIYSTNCFQATKSSDISLFNVTLWTCPGMGFVATHTMNVKLDNFQIRKKDGRWMSSAADGIHLTNVRGTVTISNSYLEGMGDDALNMHNNMLVVREINATHVGLSKSNIVYVGDVIEFGRPNNPLIPYMNTTITSVFELDTLNVTYVTFDTDISQINVLDTAVIQTIATAHIYNVTVSKNRARGFQMNNRLSLIEDCILDQTTGPAVLIACEKTGEGNCAHNLMFRNNLINDCNYGTAQRKGLVYLFASSNSTAQPAGVFQSITFESNRFEGPVAQSFFFVGSARGVIIKNNTFDNSRQSPNETIAVICSSEDVRLECNRLAVGLNDNTTNYPLGFQFSTACPEPSGKVDVSNAFDTCQIGNNNTITPSTSPTTLSIPSTYPPGQLVTSDSPSTRIDLIFVFAPIVVLFC